MRMVKTITNSRNNEKKKVNKQLYINVAVITNCDRNFEVSSNPMRRVTNFLKAF